MKKVLVALTIMLLMNLVFLTNSFAQKGDVISYEIEEEILEHNQLPLDPYPPFGLLTGYITYPFQFYGSKYFQITKKKIKILIAENEYLKIGMCSDYGGRLWFVYDKIREKEVIHRNYKEAKFYNAGMGYQYLGGGLELNIPNAHSQTNARKRECTINKNEDGSVSLIMSNTEKIGRLHWQVSFTLFPGVARIRQDVRIANEGLLEERYLYWANCGIPVNGNTEFIYPENRGALHGKYENAVSWPIYANTDISLLKNVDEAVGFYMLGAREGYMGYYNHDENFGLVHYADVNDLPGKKYWSWGWHITAQAKKYTHAEGVNYGEIQSGRIIIQEKFDKIAPMTSFEYTHFWYPVGAIGSFNGASENAAINFRLEKKTKESFRANIKIQANQKYENSVLLMKYKDQLIKEIKISSLSPESPLILSEEIEINSDKINDVSLYLLGNNKKVISKVLSAFQKPEQIDSYFKPEKYLEKVAKNFTAEGLFAKAETLFNDWFYHLPEIKEILFEVINVDPGFSKAHTELGLIDLRGGNFDSALKYFNKSLERIPDDGRTLYYKGLALRYLGDNSEAIYYLRQSGRFGYEYPERITEAEIALNRNDLNEAKKQIDKAVKLNGTILKGFIYKTIIAKRLKNYAEAKEMLARANSLDSENPFVLCTDFIINNNDKIIAQNIKKRYADYPEELLEVVSTFYGAGLIYEASQIINLIEKTNSIIDLYRTTLQDLIQNKSKINTDSKTIAADFAWRIEEYFILLQKIEQDPKNATLFYHLGNFHYAHDLEDDGIANWEKAYELGYESKIILVSLYRANKKLGNKDKAFKFLLEAYDLDNNDPYIFEYYVSEIRSRKGVQAAIELMEDNYARFENVYSLKASLMNSYLNEGEYSKLETLLINSNLHDTHRLSFGEFWKNLKMARGYNKLKEEKYNEALVDFEAAINVPKNIAQHYMVSFSSQARRLF